MTPKFIYVYMTLCCLTDIDLYQKIHYAIYIYYTTYIIWCLLGYICSCFLHTLDRLVRGYTLSRLCTLPRKSQRFIAREQKLVYSSDKLITKKAEFDSVLTIHWKTHLWSSILIS